MKRMPFPLILLVGLVITYILAIYSVSSAGEVIDLIDTPTPQITEQGGYNVNFRFYSMENDEGSNISGLLAGLFFGVLEHMNLGVYLDTENMIGNDDIKLRRPRLFVKFYLFSGTEYFPSIGVGYDDQGYGEYKDGKYEQRERGFFIVLCKENFLPNLEVCSGINGYDFDKFRVRGFVSLFSKMYENIIPMLEFDNLGGGREVRINIGLRYFITPSLNVEIDGRDIAHTHGFDRIFRIGYMSAF
ncbi:hypothetical protein GTN66_01880 [bacterium]|nr:hypothetical protein [bacterium]NIN91965.1 hypothetical protein [bacterium]NIO18181.1 hypothetical protein [bacterium]NIO73155.1 hypothetical protein [bacterium]